MLQAQEAAPVPKWTKSLSASWLECQYLQRILIPDPFSPPNFSSRQGFELDYSIGRNFNKRIALLSKTGFNLQRRGRFTGETYSHYGVFTELFGRVQVLSPVYIEAGIRGSYLVHDNEIGDLHRAEGSYRLGLGFRAYKNFNIFANYLRTFNPYFTSASFSYDIRRRNYGIGISYSF